MHVEQSSERNHLSVFILGVEIADIGNLRAVVGFRLEPDLETLIELVELVDVCRPEIGLKGREYVVNSNAQRLRHRPIDIQLELRTIGAESGRDTSQIGILVGLRDNELSGLLKFA